MSETVQAKRGARIEPAEAMALDPSRMVVGRPTAPPPEVAGQERYVIVFCPWCGGIPYFPIECEESSWCMCWNCGMPFRV